ncbi:MAG: SDR family NAD(P)-dependent oxidoreductase [Gemmatimonadaceae bacterium]|nr:SDR family NAD(P)-dependent oxidoreductase [Gemmatimonadaceae bacterium]
MTGPGRPVALVTGASAGLGAEFARQLAALRYDIVAVARRRNRLEQLASELGDSHGVRVEVIAADLADIHAPRMIADQVAARGLEVDYLVNNAGSAGSELIEDRDWGAHASFLQLMMTSMAHLCHLFVPGMCERGHGRIINVASVAGRIAQARDTSYGPTKAYVVALSEALHLTCKHQGVNVCALCPGFTHTEFHEVADMLDLKAASPGFIWYDADVVVREGLAAVEKGKCVYVSGRIYRWIDPMLQSVFLRRLIQRLAAR